MSAAVNEAARRFRAALEAMVASGIDLMDALDAEGFDREPDGDDEVVSEDDGVVIGLKHVGMQR